MIDQTGWNKNYQRLAPYLINGQISWPTLYEHSSIIYEDSSLPKIDYAKGL